MILWRIIPKLLIFSLICIALYVNIRTLQVLMSPEVRINDSPSETDSISQEIFVASTSGQLFARPAQPSESSPTTANEPSSVSRRFGIELKGTVAGEIAVVVELATSREMILHPDDAVGNGKVERISRSELVLTEGTFREVLTLNASSSSTPTQQGTGAINLIDRTQLGDILSRVDRMSQEISLTPVRDADGDAAGYRVTALKPRGFFASLGLKQNDMITSVNGQIIRTVEDLHRVLGDASHSSRLTLNLRRNQKDVQMQFDIR